MTDLRELAERAFGGRLTIERELGGGGMSRVFVARERAIGRAVVVKTLPPELAAEVNVERFRREIAIAATLQHPHIVPLLEVGQEPQLLAYSMPFIEGESLRERITRDGALPVSDAMRFWQELLDALAYAHGRGLVHRDIKPENALCSGRHLQITDFGVARALGEAGAGASRMTATGLSIGTPAYMAPEQVAGESVDARADVYAAGLVMWEMLVGRHPFAGMNPTQMMAAHATRVPPAVADERPAVPPALSALVARCLEKTPADRPQSADAVLAELERIPLPTPGATTPPQATQSVKVVRPTPAGTAGRRVARLAAGVVLLVGVAAGGWWFSTKGRGSTGATAAVTGDTVQRGVLIAPEGITAQDSASMFRLVRLMASDIEAMPNVTAIYARPAMADLAMRVLGVPPSFLLDPDTLTYFGKRTGSHAFIRLGAISVGRGVRLTARVLDARDESLGTYTETVADTADLLSGMQRLSTQVTAALRDTLRFLTRAEGRGLLSTQSLEVMRMLDAGWQAFTNRDYIEAAERYRSVTALEPGFAWGHRQLYVSLNNLGARRAERLRAIARAMDEAGKARPFEQKSIAGLYYSSGVNAPDSALALYRAQLQQEPQNSTLRNNMALILLAQHDWAAAEGLLREAVRITPNYAWVAHGNLMSALMAQGKQKAADSVLAEIKRLSANGSGAYDEIRPGLLALARDPAGLDSAMSALLAATPDSLATRRLNFMRGQWAARLAQGRLGAADESARALDAAYERLGDIGNRLDLAARRARYVALVGGDVVGARAQLTDALRRFPLESMDPLDRPYAVLAEAAVAVGDRAGAARLLAEREKSVPSRFRNTDGPDLARARSAVASASGDVATAVREARAADVGSCAPCGLAPLALAFDRAGQADSARRVYAAYLSTPSSQRAGSDALFLPIAYQRLAELSENAGDTKTAIANYQALADLWRAADAPLQPAVKRAKERIAALSAKTR